MDQTRFGEAEPLYNGWARVTGLGGEIAVVDRSGTVRLVSREADRSEA